MAKKIIVDYCAFCGKPIYAASPQNDPDEYVETLDGLVHYWECWSDYGYEKKTSNWDGYDIDDDW